MTRSIEQIEIHTSPDLSGFSNGINSPVEFFSGEKFRARNPFADALRAGDKVTAEKYARFVPEISPRSGGDNRLVNTCKSPTKPKGLKFDEITGEIISTVRRESALRVYGRSWNDEKKIRVESVARLQDAPAPNMGARWTDELSPASARKIIESGAFLSATQAGYKTFFTLTFTPENAASVANVRAIPGEIGKPGDFCAGVEASGAFQFVEFDTQQTIGALCSKFFDAAQKMYQRGWDWLPHKDDDLATKAMELQKIDGLPGEKLRYCWVAENPDKTGKKGDQIGDQTAAGRFSLWPRVTTPHVHVLIDWQVEPWAFRTWAARLEKLWGQGFAHIERIHSSSAAAGYLLKALGYVTKGGDSASGQGRIRGNRYNISKPARAPGWECIAEFTAQNMGAFVRAMGLQLQARQKAISAKLADIREQKKAAKKSFAIAGNISAPAPEKLKRRAFAEKMLKHYDQSEKQLKHQRGALAWGNAWQVVLKTTQDLRLALGLAVERFGWTPRFRQNAGAIKAQSGLIEWAKQKQDEIKANWQSLCLLADAYDSNGRPGQYCPA